MKKIFAVVTVSLLCIFFFVVPRAHSDEYDDLTKQISDLNRALNMSLNATAPLESQLNSMEKQVSDIKARLAAISLDIAVKRKHIDDGYKTIEEKTKILNQKIRDYYIKSYYDSPIVTFLGSGDSSQITELLTYQKTSADQDKQVITNIVLSIGDLENQKKALEIEESNLTTLQASLDEQSAKLDKIVTGAKQYQASLSSQIADLSAKQQQLLAAKLGSLNIPLFAISGGGCSSDINPSYKDPGFDGKKFGLFSYGVPNRVGLNQYGAFGRAKANQNSDTILHAYYNFDGYQNYSGITIRVNDSNGFDSGNIIWSGSLEDYMQRIYEVPNEWGDQGGMEAIKAQTIAARSYVLASTNNGASSICATQSCQVFKTDPKGGHWGEAVGQTSGQAMIQGGQPIKAWFSSTHGGYIFSSSDIGWGATSFTKHAQDSSSPIASWADLQNNAYDKDSPWFYCDWGGRSQYNNTAWMTSSEMADVVNSILLVQNDASADSHILQTDSSDPEMWSSDRVRQELTKYRTPFNSIDSGSVDADFANGKSTNVHFSGDGGNFDVDSSTFRKYFNLRAPAKIQIVGYLYNLEIR